MADDLGKDGQWRDTVDTRLDTLETKVDEQAGLRAAMDKDMGDLKVEFRAQRKLLQALHDTQQEHTAQFGEVREQMQKGFERLHAGVDAILGLLGGKPSTSD
jgi:hypothetical protein